MGWAGSGRAWWFGVYIGQTFGELSFEGQSHLHYAQVGRTMGGAGHRQFDVAPRGSREVLEWQP